MDRKAFIPAQSLNILAAAWIQFQVHDWVAHARRRLGEATSWCLSSDGYPDWASSPDGERTREMRISGNIPHPGAKDPWLFANTTSHWWDGSEVYGSDAERARALRDGAQDPARRTATCRTTSSGFEMTGFNESWWMGLSAMHTLSSREHNVLVDELQRAYPSWDDERTYQTARLIVSALIAKIHTIEWTPAILGTEALDIGMKTNWYGPPSGDWMTKLGIWLTDVHALKGIPKTMPDHHAAPYSLTEEFATVYRMHPLIPDDYIFYDFGSGAERERQSFLDIQGTQSDAVMRRVGLRDALYSFGVAHPGAITLHNFPKSLQHFERERRGHRPRRSSTSCARGSRRVPRYNGFRRGLHMPPVGAEPTSRPTPRRTGSAARSTAGWRTSTRSSASWERTRPTASASRTRRSASSS